MVAALARLKERETRVLVLAAVALACLQVAWLHHVRFDDAYITFRYGANLARGRGLVFNVGDRLMGSTSPGECLLAALAYVVAGPERMLDVMASLGSVALVGQGVVLYRMLRAPLGRLGAALVGLAAAVGAANGGPWVALETHVATALALLALERAIARRPLLAATAAAAATMMRPDAALLLAPLGALAFVDARARGRLVDPWKPAALYAALLLPWLSFATWYFGTPLPQSAVRKFQHTGVVDYATWIGTLLAFPFGVSPAWRAVAVVPWALAIAGGYALVRRDRRLAAFIAYPALHAAAYLVLRPDIAFVWHLYPATLSFTALVVTRLVSLEGKVRPIARALAVLLIAYGLYRCGDFALRDSFTRAYGGRESVYRAVAEYLRAHAEPGDVVGAEEVGTIGYVSDLPMNDNAGITTRDPQRAYEDILAGRTTPLRWMVLNKVDLERARVLYGDRTLTRIDVNGYVRWVVDLREAQRAK